MAKAMHGGARARGGRPKGRKSRVTILRETKKAEAIAKIVDSGKPLALTVLQKAMEFAEGAVAAYRPTMAAEAASGKAANPDGSHEEFGKWFDRWFKCIERMAEYQTPKVKAMEAPTPPPEVGTNKRRFTLRVFEGGKPVAPIGTAKDDAA